MKVQPALVPDGNRFRQRRQRLKLSQADLALEFGVTRDTVSRWEQGQRRIRPLVWMAMMYLDGGGGPEKEVGSRVSMSRWPGSLG